jgi:hypothetical protein
MLLSRHQNAGEQNYISALRWWIADSRACNFEIGLSDPLNSVVHLGRLLVATSQSRYRLLSPAICSVLVTIAANSNADGVSDNQIWGTIVKPCTLSNGSLFRTFWS